MEILRTDSQKHTSVQLTKDYKPNPAMVNEFQTLFFTCKINHIEIVERELNDYVIDDMAQYVLLDISIHNITNEILSMFRDDFMISYDKETPYEPEEYFHVASQFPDEYALKPNETLRGKLVFIVSKSAKQLVFRYTEYFDDESEGKTYRLKYMLK